MKLLLYILSIFVSIHLAGFLFAEDTIKRNRNYWEEALKSYPIELKFYEKGEKK